MQNLTVKKELYEEYYRISQTANQLSVARAVLSTINQLVKLGFCVATYEISPPSLPRGVFRTLSNICDGAFLQK